jgi:hypothetical protein
VAYDPDFANFREVQDPFLISKQHYSYFFLKKTKMNQVAEEGLYM